MAKAIEQLRSGLTIGHAKLGRHGAALGSVKQQVHDGDTVVIQADGNLSIRFLGIDAPETSFTLPAVTGDQLFVPLSDPRFARFLEDPFAAEWRPFAEPLDGALRGHLASRLGADVAANHSRHAKAAERELEELVEQDLADQGVDREMFRFFLAFAGEVMDRYGRLLAFVNRDEADETQRPPSYNMRLLEAGVVCPYFIWPNVDPFRKSRGTVAAVPEPGSGRELAEGTRALKDTRRFFADARDTGAGLFAPADPLRIEPFEVRFLAGRRAPSRWLIDLSKDDDSLIPPQDYFSVPHAEDRLFIPEEYVPLFAEKGWRRPA